MELSPLTSAEAAEVLKVDRHTIGVWVRRGRLRPVKRLPGRTGGYLFSVAEVARVAALPPLKKGRPRKDRPTPQAETLPDAS